MWQIVMANEDVSSIP